MVITGLYDVKQIKLQAGASLDCGHIFKYVIKVLFQY